MKVRDYELDIQGIVNNANYQHYFEVARHEFLLFCGVDFAKMHQEGIEPVLTSISIKFKQPLTSGKEFYATVDKIEKKGARYIFHQSIISNEFKFSEAIADVVILVNNKPIRRTILDDIFRNFLTS